MKRLPIDARAAYQHQRFYDLWSYQFRGQPHGRRYLVRGRPYLWRRWEARHALGTYQLTRAWWLRLAGRQMLRGLQRRWTFRYTTWMIRQCAKEHQE